MHSKGLICLTLRVLLVTHYNSIMNDWRHLLYYRTLSGRCVAPAIHAEMCANVECQAFTGSLFTTCGQRNNCHKSH